MPLEHSERITRRQLAALSGGKIHDKRYENPLRLGTPFSFCGGRAIASSGGICHHICVKEDSNLPPPDSAKNGFILYRIAKRDDKGQLPQVLPFDVQIFRKKDPRQGSIPLFWESSDQKRTSTKDDSPVGGNRVSYFGHWNVVKVEEIDQVILKLDRCAAIHLEFDRYDTRFARIISKAHDKTCEEIGELNFDDSTSMSEEEDGDGSETQSKNPRLSRKGRNQENQKQQAPRQPAQDPTSSVSAESITSDPSPGTKRRKMESKQPTDEGQDDDGDTSARAKPEAFSFFTVHLQGQKDGEEGETDPFIRLKNAVSRGLTFRDLRQAIDDQLDLDMDFRFLVEQLGNMSRNQETWEVKSVVPQSDRNGSIGSPYQITIKLDAKSGRS